jgi:hypothetical protein
MMNWKVTTTVQASKFEKPYEREIAYFENYINAEDFIKFVMPKETQDRFKIERI